jgi:hypothetical protein
MATRDIRGTREWPLLMVVGVLNAAVLVLTAAHQIYDTNFYTLWEATALTAGDHPYRDFFEWGAPLQALVSVVGQRLAGNRLIGEFAIQWLAIISGALISFHLGYRASRSVAASLVTMAFAVAILAATATYHYPKLLLYPLAVWTMWRYMERPGVGRAGVVGVVAAAAFLFRHDHGVYVAAGAALAFFLARVARSSTSSLRLAITESGASAATAIALLVPWLVLVHASEGLPEYIQARLERYGVGSPYTNPYGSLLATDPIHTLTTAASRDGMMWLQQVGLLVPLLVLVVAAVDALRSRRRGELASLETCTVTVAAAFVALIGWRQFREPAYVTGVVPLTAALSAHLLARSVGGRNIWNVVTGVVAVGLLIVTAVATYAAVRDTEIFTPRALAAEVPDVFAQMMTSPPIDAFAPPQEIARFDRSNWNEEEVHLVEVLMRYVHDCTAEGDRVLVTGQTPFQVGYYLERPIAGGHLFWHEKWRSDPRREMQSLELLQRQSVPFAYSTHDPVFNDFAPYPRIREYLKQYYVELEGSRGLVLIDTRRQPTGTFGTLGFPCFARR